MISQSVVSLLTLCWPGASGVWRRGDLHSLIVSLLYGLVVNIALLGSFVWPEWISSWGLLSLWTGIAVGAFGACVQTLWKSNRGASSESIAQSHRSFVDAQEYYLQGNYFEAEQLLRKSLVSNEEDVDAALLMVSILRRTGRYAEALERIHRTMLFDVAARWEAEFHDEKQRCIRAQFGTPPAHN